MAGSKTVEAAVALTLHDRLTAGLNRIQARMNRLTSGLGVQRLTSAFSDLGAKLGGIGPAVTQSIGRLSALTGLMGVGAGGAAYAAFGLANNTATAAKEIGNLSRLAGVGAEDFQRYAYAADTVGISGEKMADIFKDVQDKVGDFVQTGGGGMADFFEKIAPKVGVTADDFARLSGPEALQLYVSSLERANVSQSDMVFYLEAIASDSTLLLPLLQNNGSEMRRLGDEAERTGNVMSDAAVAFGGEFLESVKSLEGRLSGLITIVGVRLMPVIKEVVDEISAWFDANQGLIRSTVAEWVDNFAQVLRDLMDPASQIRENIQGIVDGFNGFVSAITPVVDLVGGPLNAGLGVLALWIGGPLLAAVAALTPAIWGLGVALLTTPIGWIIGGMVALGAAIYLLIDNWDAVVAAWDSAWANIKAGVDQFVADFLAGWEALSVKAGVEFQKIKDTIELKWNEIVSWGTGLADTVRSWFEIDLYAVGEAIVQSLLNGLNAAWAGLVSSIQTKIAELTASLPDWAKGWLGIEITPTVKTAEEMESMARQAAEGAASQTPGGGVFGMGQSETYEADKAAAYQAAYDAEIARLTAQNAALQAQVGVVNVGVGGNVTAPSAVPEVTTQTVEAGSVTANTMTLPEPLLTHQPQTVNAPFNAGGIVVNVQGMTQAEAQAVVQRALQNQAAQHSQNVTSALND